MIIAFIGTGQFAAYILEKLAKTDLKPDFLICASDKPIGRKQKILPCPAKKTAQQYDIKIIELKSLKNQVHLLKKIKIDIILTTDTNFYVPQNILNLPQYGCLNIHPSLLPKYRGPSPIQSSLLKGASLGVSIIQMNEKIDAGPIISKEKLDALADQLDYPKAEKALASLGVNLLIKTLPKWINREIKPVKQKEPDATLTNFIKKEDGLIDWHKTALEIDRQIRAFTPWPGTYTFFKKKGQKIRLKILKAHPQTLKNTYQTGKIILTKNNQIGVKCKENILILEKVQPAGKNIMTSKAFLNGYREIKQFI
jgi:methionyl-tRNA formyltransferase